MEIGKEHVNSQSPAKHKTLIYLLMGIGVLAILISTTSLWPEVLDQLVKSLREAIRAYVGF